MTKLTLVTAMMVAAIVTVGAIKALTPVRSPITTPQSASTSIEELQRKIDVQSLPVMEVKEPY
jgi:hypothetical protein